MTKKEILETHPDDINELLFMDGYDDCITGIMMRFNLPPIVCYDKNKVIQQLMRDGMAVEEAEEWFSFNQIVGWLGERTPCFLVS